jgi:hypothetical protein
MSKEAMQQGLTSEVRPIVHILEHYQISLFVAEGKILPGGPAILDSRTDTERELQLLMILLITKLVLLKKLPTLAAHSQLICQTHY